MTDVKALSQERDQLFIDVFEGKIPKRVPIEIVFPNEFAIQYSGRNLTEAQWDTTQYEGRPTYSGQYQC